MFNSSSRALTIPLILWAYFECWLLRRFADLFDCSLSVVTCRYLFLFLDLFYLAICIPSYLSASRPSEYSFLIQVLSACRPFLVFINLHNSQLFSSCLNLTPYLPFTNSSTGHSFKLFQAYINFWAFWLRFSASNWFLLVSFLGLLRSGAFVAYFN